MYTVNIEIYTLAGFSDVKNKTKENPFSILLKHMNKSRKYGTTVTLPRTERPSKNMTKGQDENEMRLRRDLWQHGNIKEVVVKSGKYIGICSLPACDNSLSYSSFVWAMR